MINKRIVSLLKKTTFWLVIFLISSSPGYSQQKKIDSLRLIIENSIGIAKYDPLIDIARVYTSTGRYNEALNIVYEAKQIAYLSGDSSRIVNSSRIIGLLFNRMDRSKEAEEILLKVLTIAKRHNLKDEYTMILNNLAVSYTCQARYDKALELNFQTLRLNEESRDDQALALSMQNIGFVYYKLKDYRKGLFYFKESLKLKRKVNEEDKLLLVNVSLCYAYIGDMLKAKIYVDSVLLCCGGEKCNDDVLLSTNFSLGVIHFGLKRLYEAEKYFLKSYNLARRLKNERFLFDNIDYLSQISLKKNKLIVAGQYLKEAEKLIEHGAPLNLELIKIYSRFSELYNELEDFRKVSFYQQKYIQLRDSIYSEELTTNLMKIETDYLEKKNEAQMAAQNQVLMLKEEVIERQALLNISVSIIAVILVISALILLKNYKEKKISNKLLELKVKERTKELELNRNELLKASTERDLLVEKTAQSIRSSLATIKGICDVGLKDISDPGARLYIQKVEETSDSLSSSLNALMHIQKKAIINPI